MSSGSTGSASLEAGDSRARVTAVSVVVPVCNEAEMLGNSVRRICAELALLQPGIELILVENGSTDATSALSDALRLELPDLVVLHLPEADYGAAMRAGLLHARGEWRVSFDIDYSSVSFVSQVLRAGATADVVLASKTMDGASDERSLARRLGTRAFNAFLALLFGARVSDTHGIKAVRARVVETLVPRVVSRRDLFDTELVLRAERAGFRILELPAQVCEIRPSPRSLLRRVPRTLAGLLRLRLQLWREDRECPVVRS